MSGVKVICPECRTSVGIVLRVDPGTVEVPQPYEVCAWLHCYCPDCDKEFEVYGHYSMDSWYDPEDLE